MRNRLALSLLLLLPLLANGQEPAFNYKAAEARLKKVIFSSPDSTKIIIDYVLSQKNLPDTLKGTIYNIYGIYHSHIGKRDSAIFYYKKSISYLKSNPRLRSLPLMNMSIMYRDKGMYNESFKCLEESLEINKKLNRKLNEAQVYSNMSSNYQYMLEYDKAVEYALRGIEIFKKENDVGQLAALNQKLANTYLKMRNFDFAEEMYTECLRIFRSTNDDINYAFTLINRAECYIHLVQFDKAKKDLKKAISMLQRIKSPEHIAIAYAKLANIARNEKNDKAADANYSAALRMMRDANSISTAVVAAEYIEFLNSARKYKEALKVIATAQKMPIFKNINAEDKARFDMAAAETYKNTNDERKALMGLERAIASKDSLARLDNEVYVKELQARFQAELQHEKRKALQARNNILQKQMDNKRALTLVYIIGSIVVIVLVLVVLRSYWLKNRLQKEALRSAEAEKMFLRQQHEHEQELTNTQKEIIEGKQRELTSSALRMAHYQDTLGDIIAKCENNAFMRVKDVKQELQYLMKQKDYLRQFETRFNSLHPEFSATLTDRFGKLTKNDVEFCSLLKLNLSYKEIASLLQISHESVITKKYRIKKKINVSDDAEFEKLLMEI